MENVWAGYGGSQILQGMSFDVNSGEIVTVFGRNGSGRSTALKTMAGIITAERGSIKINDRELVGLRPHTIARAGVAYVPEDRQVFSGLTVEENLRLGQTRKKGFWTLERIWGLFPRLLERRSVNAGVLSGGEQQMLTVCRSLIGNPEAILIDEADGRTRAEGRGAGHESYLRHPERRNSGRSGRAKDEFCLVRERSCLCRGTRGIWFSAALRPNSRLTTTSVVPGWRCDAQLGTPGVRAVNREVTPRIHRLYRQSPFSNGSISFMIGLLHARR